jgi:glycerol uptake facilitator-like aquaporin
MIIISIIAGFLSTMNVWAVSWDHVRLHLNDVYMVSLMILWMVALYSFYLNMFSIAIISFFLIALVLCFIKKQVGVNDKQFLKGMIPHHSMAIRMAESIKDKTSNKRIYDFASTIIKTQTDEIRIMKELEKE